MQEYLADKHPRSIFLSDQVCVLTHPAKPRAHRPGFVHGWLNVYAAFAFRLRPLLFNPRQKFAQFLTDDFVIVVTPGVTRDLTCYRTSSDSDRLCNGLRAEVGGTDCMLM